MLGDMPLIAVDDRRTGLLVSSDHFAVLFGVELLGQRSRTYQVTEHHRQLPPLGGWGLGSSQFGVRSLWSGRRWRTWHLKLGTWNWRSPGPHQHFAVFVGRQFFDFDEFFLEGVQQLFREVKL